MKTIKIRYFRRDRSWLFAGAGYETPSSPHTATKEWSNVSDENSPGCRTDADDRHRRGLCRAHHEKRHGYRGRKGRGDEVDEGQSQATCTDHGTRDTRQARNDFLYE